MGAFAGRDPTTVYKELVAEYPWLTQKYLNAGHKRDPVEILRTAAGHARQLMADPSYAAVGPRAQPFSFDVYLLRDRAPGARPDDRVLEQAALDIQSEVASRVDLGALATWQQAREAALIQDIGDLSEARVDGVMTGLAHCLSPDQKAKLFAIGSLKEKLVYLRSLPELPVESLQGFQFDRFPAMQARSWPDILAWGESKSASQNSLGIRLLALLRLYDLERTHPQNQAYDARTFAQFRAGEITPFLSQVKDEDSALMTRLFASLSRDRDPAKTKTIRSFVSKRLEEEFSRRGITAQQLSQENRFEVVETLHVEEASPVLSLFRGFVGNNCSSEGSASYSILPTSRTFYVRSGNNPPMGYIEMIRLKQNGDNEWSYLIHDMDGVFAKPQAQAVLFSIRDQRAAFGVNKFSFLLQPYRAGHMNSAAAVEAFGLFGSQAVALVLQDTSLRAIAGRGLTRTGYDSGGHYTQGNPFTGAVPAGFLYRSEPKVMGPELKARMEERARDEFLATLDLAMRDVVDGKQVQASNPEIARAVQVLTNSQGLPFAAYEESWRVLFEKKGIRANTDFRKDRAVYFLLGRMSVSDRAAPEVARKAEQAISELARLTPEHPRLQPTYNDPSFRGFWEARLGEVSGFRGADPGFIKSLYLHAPYLRDRILSSPLFLALLAVSKAKELEADAEIPFRLAALPEALDLPPPLLLPLSRLLSNSDLKVPEIFSKIAMQMLPRFDLRTFNEATLPKVERDRIVKELKISFVDEQDLEMARLAGQALLRSGLINEEFYKKYQPKFSKDPAKTLEMQRLDLLDALYTQVGGTCAARVAASVAEVPPPPPPGAGDANAP